VVAEEEVVGVVEAVAVEFEPPGPEQEAVAEPQPYIP
jgi:hypothetical protein